jgi:receptor protein-tyrosine kinase
MSIIEKAVNKLSRTEPAFVAPLPQTPAPDSLIELAARVPEAAQHAQFKEKSAPQPAVRPVQTIDSGTPPQSINRAKLKQMGLVTPDGERSQIAEEFRLIKRPLLMNAFGQGAAPIKNGNLIMVTSSLPGEGKSFCAINLAISIAMEMDRTVLLVDADVAKPRIPHYLGLHAERGLLDVLRDEHLALADVLIKTDIENLTVLPAGHTYRQATELLASEAMNSLIRDIQHRYPDRIVIFDSPPLLATSEAGVLAAHMGQIVMVVEAEKTPQGALKEALAQIESCEVIGMVLNKTTALPGTNYYYGYYGSPEA